MPQQYKQYVLGKQFNLW